MAFHRAMVLADMVLTGQPSDIARDYIQIIIVYSASSRTTKLPNS